MKEKILKILDDYKIDYSTSGKNIGKKSIAGINCPFCGDDEGKHLGIMSGWYTCWKNSTHKGNLPFLFSTLLGVSLAEARLLLQENKFVDDDYFLDNLENLCYNNNMNEKKRLGGVSTLEMPKEFNPINTSIFGKMFIRYLRGRGLEDWEGLVKKYDVRYCIQGEWAYRLIFPLYYENKFVSWIGRSIDRGVSLRYRDSSIEESIRHPKFCLYNYDNLVGGDTLFITEGIFDTIKLDYYGNKDSHSTAILTTSITDEQIALLLKKTMLYDNVHLMLDRGAELQLINLLDRLSFIRNLKWTTTPFGAEDPGALTKEQVESLENVY